MAAKIYYSPFIPAFSPNGLPVPGAFLYFYYSGTNTLAPIYNDSSLMTPVANPVQADLAARFPDIYLNDAIVYRVRLTDPLGTPLGADIDPYIPGEALRGPAGPAGNVRATLADLQVAPTTDYTSIYKGGLWTWVADAIANGTTRIAKLGSPTGAWVLQTKIVHVDDYILPADSDATAGFVRAIAEIASTGGAIVVRADKKYRVSSQITVSSIYPITITSDVFGQVYNANGPGIAYTAAMNSVFRVISPSARNNSGGVHFNGLSFYDNTGSGGSPGSNVISRAVLDLYDAPLSSVENCHFHFVNGSVIRTDFFVQSSIRGLRIRYCGAVGKKVLHLGATDSALASQSVIVDDCRIEVCYGDSYVYTDVNSQSVTLSKIVFEAATTEYPLSNVPFMDLDGVEYKVIGCAINRNDAQAVILRGRGIVTASSFMAASGSNEMLYIPGSRNVIVANTFVDNRTNNSIRSTGVLNMFGSNRFFASGGVSLEGANNQFNDNIVDSPTKIGGGYFLSLGDYCSATGNHFNSYDFQGSGYAPSVNAVALYGMNTIFTNNQCRGWTGKTFIRVENATATYQPNVHDGVGTFVTSGVTLNTVASASALTLPYGPCLITVTGTTGITSILAGPQWAGMKVTLVFTGALTVTDGGNLKLASNFTTTADDTLTIACDGVNWYEVARSAN